MVQRYQVNRDGTGRLVDGSNGDAAVNDSVGDGDLLPVVAALQQLSGDIRNTFDAIPNRGEAHFNAGVRQALLTAGNDLDYVFRLLEDVRRDQNILRLRAELEAETKNLLTQGESTQRSFGGEAVRTMPPHVTLTEAERKATGG